MAEESTRIRRARGSGDSGEQGGGNYPDVEENEGNGHSFKVSLKEATSKWHRRCKSSARQVVRP